MSPLIETQRLSLDELSLDRDELFIFQLLNEPGFLDNIGDRGITDLDSAGGYIERTRAGYAANGFGLWRVVEKSTGAAVGICGLVRRDGLDDPDVGYAFLEAVSGRGYATEAAAAALGHGRNALGIGRIVAITKPDNLGSIRVLEKIGLKFEKRIQLPGHDGESSFFTT
jgi:RimJ/RimL family protein N-acetyltransferase